MPFILFIIAAGLSLLLVRRGLRWRDETKVLASANAPTKKLKSRSKEQF